MNDFFISYTEPDRQWAEWISWELTQAGYSVIVQAWDFRPGNEFVREMDAAIRGSDHVIAVLTEAYLATSPMGAAEWGVAFAEDPTGQKRKLIPIRVEPCEPTGLLRTRIYADLVGLDAPTARASLLAGVAPGDGRPAKSPPFPGGDAARGPGGVHTGPRFPGSLPLVFTVPFMRDPLFTGRADQVARLRTMLETAGQRHAVAVTGTAGVGKTGLAVEYAYRHHVEFDVVWWVRAQEATLLSDYAALVGHQHLPDPPARADHKTRAEQADAARHWLEQHDRWLLILDNVEAPSALSELLPRGGGGQVLFTARGDVGWSRLAVLLELDPLDREHGAGFLLSRTNQNNREAALALADDLGGLPLALQQAAGYLAETGGISIDDYRTMFRTRTAELLGKSEPGSTQDTIAATWALALERLTRTAPAAVALLNCAAYLDPDDVPTALFLAHYDLLPEPIGAAAADPLAFADTLNALRRHGLVKVTSDSLILHRLLQAVIRHQLPSTQQGVWANIAVQLLAAAHPRELMADSAAWPWAQRLLPHVLVSTAKAWDQGVAPNETSWLLDRAATYLQTQGQFRDALPLFQRALDVRLAVLGARDPLTAVSRSNLGALLRALGDLSGAQDQHERALAILLATAGPDHLDTAACRSSLGLVLLERRDLVGAREQQERALAITLASRDSEDALVASRRSNLSAVMHAQSDLTGARYQIEEALRISLTALGPSHLDTARRRSNLGAILLEQKNLAAARDQFEKALEIALVTVGPGHPFTADCRNNLGAVLHAQKDMIGGREQLEQALAITVASLGPDHHVTALRRGNLGLVLYELGHLEAARDQLELALTVTRSALGPNHPDTARWGYWFNLVVASGQG